MNSRHSLALLLTFLLACSLMCSWSLKVVNGQQVTKVAIRDLFQPTADSWTNEEFMLEMAHHPAFDEHLETILSDLDSFDFEADEELMEYVSTLSDSDAKFFRRAFRGIGRAFRGIGGFVRKAGRAFRHVGKGLGKIGRGVGKFVKRYGKILIPIALTVATGGLGGVSLAGSLGTSFAKGAALLAKASAIASKGQAILGGLNLVTGGRVKILNKALNFVNKVNGVLGKGSMFLNAGNSLVGNLSNFSVKNLASQLKPSQLFKGSTLFEKGSNFLNKASTLIKKGQQFTSNLNNLTGGRVKFINKLSNSLDRAQTIAGIGTDALKGLNGGFNSLKNLKNLKGADLKKLLTTDNIKKTLGRLDNTITKSQDIVSRINQVTGGNNKSINKILNILDKGKLAIGAGNTAIDRFTGIKNSIADLKNLKNTDLKKLLTIENVQKGLTKLDKSLGSGKDLLQQINAINGGKSQRLNDLIKKLEKGQQAVGIGSGLVDGYKGLKGSVKDLKNIDLKQLLTIENIQKGLGKLDNTLGKSKDLIGKMNEFTEGRSKTLQNLEKALTKGQQAVGIGSSVVDKYKGIKGSIADLSNLKEKDLKKLLTFDNIQTGLSKLGGALENTQELVSKLNEFTDGRSKTLVNLIGKLQKGQKVTAVTSSILDSAKGVKGSIEQLKNLKKEDLIKILDSENLQSSLNRMAKAFAKGENIASQLNEITGGKNKDLIKLVDALRKGQKVSEIGAGAVEKVSGLKNAVQDLKKVNLNELLNEDNLEKAVDGIKNVFENGKDLVEKAKELRNEFRKPQENNPEPDMPQEPVAQPETPEPEPIGQDVNAEIDPATASG